MLEYIDHAETASKIASLFFVSLWCFTCFWLARSVKKRWAFREMLLEFYLQNVGSTGTDATAAEFLKAFCGSVDGDIEITREDIRDELIRDPVATRMMVDDDTPEDVQRYLYLEALRRARFRKMDLLDDCDNDLFAAPRRCEHSDSDTDFLPGLS